VSDETDFNVLMGRVRAGDAGAYEELLARYGGAVRSAVRRRLHERLRNHYDSLDFVQDVWASFLAIDPDRYRFADQDALVKFLCRIARNKVVEVFRRRFATRRADIRRELPLESRDESRGGPVGRDATPSQVAIADEQLAGMMRQLSEGHRAVLERLRDGHTHAEVAAMLNVSVRTVERIVRRLRDLNE
jgi:RNA polymerase sigma-70 factor (ECF subfamily)